MINWTDISELPEFKAASFEKQMKVQKLYSDFYADEVPTGAEPPPIPEPSPMPEAGRLPESPEYKLDPRGQRKIPLSEPLGLPFTLSEPSDSFPEPYGQKGLRFKTDPFVETLKDINKFGGKDKPFTISRIISQNARALGQGVADFYRGLQAYVKAGGTRPHLFGREIELSEEDSEFLSKREGMLAEQLEDAAKTIPKTLPGTSGLFETATTGMTRFLPTMVATGVMPAAGAPATFTQLLGMKYGELREKGIDDDTAFQAATLSAAGQAPIEFLGNLTQLRTLGKVINPKTANKFLNFVGGLIKTGAIEGLEETLQTFPDEISTLYAENADKPAGEIVKIVSDQIPKIKEQARIAGVVGAAGGLMLGGGAGMISAAQKAAEISRTPADTKALVGKPPTEAPTEAPAEMLRRLDELKAKLGEDFTLQGPAYGETEQRPIQMQGEALGLPAPPPAQPAQPNIFDTVAEEMERAGMPIEQPVTEAPEMEGIITEPAPPPDMSVYDLADVQQQQVVPFEGVPEPVQPPVEKPVTEPVVIEPVTEPMVEKPVEKPVVKEFEGRQVKVTEEGTDYVQPLNRPDKVLVEIPVEKIDEAWKKQPENYLPTKETGTTEIKGRREAFQEWESKRDQPIESPTPYINEDGSVEFIDGRHRFAVLRDRGDKTVVVAVDQNQVENFKQLSAEKPTAKVEEVVTPPIEEKPLTKKEKAMGEYKDYVSGLTTEQRQVAGKLIKDKPVSPAVQMRAIKKKLKDIKLKEVEKAAAASQRAEYIEKQKELEPLIKKAHKKYLEKQKAKAQAVEKAVEKPAETIPLKDVVKEEVEVVLPEGKPKEQTKPFIPSENFDILDIPSKMDQLNKIKEKFNVNKITALKYRKKIEAAKTDVSGVSPKGEEVGIPKDVVKEEAVEPVKRTPEKLPRNIWTLKKVAKEKGIDISDIKGKGAADKIAERIQEPAQEKKEVYPKKKKFDPKDPESVAWKMSVGKTDEIKQNIEQGKLDPQTVRDIIEDKRMELKPAVKKSFNEMVDKAEKIKKEKIGGGGTTLYSGIPVSEISKAYKKVKGKIFDAFGVKLSDKDAKFWEEYIDMPAAFADKYPDTFGKIYKVLQTRNENKHLIKNDYVVGTGMSKSWSDLSKKDVEEVGKLLWRGDQLGKRLGEAGLKKLKPNIREAYKKTREVLDYIWFEDRINLISKIAKEEDMLEDDDIQAMINEAGQLEGFMPHPREGTYFAHVKDPVTGESLWNEHFDDLLLTASKVFDREGGVGLKAPFVKRRLQKQFANALVDVGKNSKVFSEEGYFEVDPGVTQELIEAAIKRAEVPGNMKEALSKALKQATADTFKLRGFMAHGVKRKNIPGFDDTNWQDAVLQYVSGWAGYKSKLMASRELTKVWPTIDWTGKEKQRRYADKYVKDTFRNQDKIDRLSAQMRGALFMQFIGGKLSSAAINGTQNMITFIPRLSMETKWAGVKTITEMVKASKDIGDMVFAKPLEGETKKEAAQKKRLTPDERRMFKRGRNDGTFQDKWAEEVFGQLPGGKFGTATKKIGNILKFPFSVAEVFNRETAGLVAFRVGKSKGMTESEAYEYMQGLLRETHFEYGDMNLPPYARGAGPAAKVARAAISFRTYAFSLMHLWGKMALRSGPEGKMALLRSLGALAMIGGVGSLPFIEMLERFSLKYFNKSIKGEIVDKFGEYYKYVLYGVPEAIGVDLSGSLGQDLPSNFWDILGAPTVYYDRTVQMVEDIKKGDYLRALEDFPVQIEALIRKPLQAYRLYKEGYTKRSGAAIMDSDFKQMKLTKGEAGKAALGFRPTRVSEERRKFETGQEVEKVWRDRKKDAIDKWSTMVRKHGMASKEAMEARRDAMALNKKMPRYISRITGATFRRKAKSIRGRVSKRERIRAREIR